MNCVKMYTIGGEGGPNGFFQAFRRVSSKKSGLLRSLDVPEPKEGTMQKREYEFFDNGTVKVKVTDSSVDSGKREGIASEGSGAKQKYLPVRSGKRDRQGVRHTLETIS